MNYKLLTMGATGILFSAILGNAIYQSEPRSTTVPDDEGGHATAQASSAESTKVQSTNNKSTNNKSTSNTSTFMPVFTSNVPAAPNRTEKVQRTKSMADSTATKRPAPSTPLQDQETGDADQQNNLNTLNNQFLSQSTDEQWSGQSTDQIYGYFNQLNQQPTGSHAELRSVECRSSLCRVEVVHDDAASADDFYLKFPQEVGEYLPSITYKIENLPDGKIDVLMYLASASFNDQ